MLKNLFALFTVLPFMLCSQQRGELWGCSSDGGHGGGTIYRIDTAGQLHVIHTFRVSDDGYFPNGEFTETPDQLLYNTNSFGGKFNRGVVYAYDTKTSTYHKRTDISDSIGWDIHDLSYGPDGKLYGLANKGGKFKGGTLVQYDPATNKLTKLHDFNYGDCCGPYGKLALLDGIFYGTTFGGGLYDGGTLFAFKPGCDTLKILHSFGLKGGSPQGDLTVYKKKLYGITNYSGLGISEFFEYDPTKNSYTSFGKVTPSEDNRDYSEGLTPYKGKLYGMAHNGYPYQNDVLYCFNPATRKLNVLARFASASTGVNPRGRLQVVGEKLYGACVYGGRNGDGTLFSFNPLTNKIQIVYNFSAQSGGQPLTVIARGNTLYGTSFNYGKSNRGGIFEYNLQDRKIKNSYWFSTSLDGFGAYGLARSSDGYVYGTTMAGGLLDKGVIFRLHPDTQKYEKIIDFDGSSGYNPMAPPIQAPNGKYYGVACNGGSYSGGTLYEYDPLGKTITAKVNFNSEQTGIIPVGPLAATPDGKLYGVTTQGGSENRGTFFEYDPLTNRLKIIAHFHEDRFGSMLFGYPTVIDGMIYLQVWKHQLSGTALIAYDPKSGAVSDPILVSEVNGAFTPGRLVQLNGRLYGLTKNPYQEPSLMVFEFDPTNLSTEKIFVFEKSGSMGELLAASDGKIYGTLMFSGEKQNGCFFALDVAKKEMKVLHEFSGSEGARPSGWLLEMR